MCPLSVTAGRAFLPFSQVAVLVFSSEFRLLGMRFDSIHLSFFKRFIQVFLSPVNELESQTYRSVLFLPAIHED